MIEIKKEFSKRELAWFGPLFALFIGIVAMLLVRRMHWNGAAIILAVLAGLLIVIYYAVPAWQTKIYRGWMLSVAPIGFVVSHILLAMVFYLVVTPIGLIMRVFGYDAMSRKLDPTAKTYWIARTQHTAQHNSAQHNSAQHYFRQF